MTTGGTDAEENVNDLAQTQNRGSYPQPKDSSNVRSKLRNLQQNSKKLFWPQFSTGRFNGHAWSSVSLDPQWQESLRLFTMEDSLISLQKMASGHTTKRMAQGTYLVGWLLLHIFVRKVSKIDIDFHEVPPATIIKRALQKRIRYLGSLKSRKSLSRNFRPVPQGLIVVCFIVQRLAISAVMTVYRTDFRHQIALKPQPWQEWIKTQKEGQSGMAWFVHVLRQHFFTERKGGKHFHKQNV